MVSEFRESKTTEIPGLSDQMNTIGTVSVL